MFKTGQPYKAKVIDAGITETSSHTPQVFLEFLVNNGEGAESNFYWSGSLLTGKPVEITIKSLIAAGFTGSDISELQNDVKPFTGESVTVTLEEYKNKLRVKYIGEPKRSKYAGPIPTLANAFAQARKDLGIKEEIKF